MVTATIHKKYTTTLHVTRLGGARNVDLTNERVRSKSRIRYVKRAAVVPLKYSRVPRHVGNNALLRYRRVALPKTTSVRVVIFLEFVLFDPSGPRSRVRTNDRHRARAVGRIVIIIFAIIMGKNNV